MRQQVGALPIRWNGDELSVLLVTSRDTQRWIIPKGWRMRGRSDADAAAQEALEEAGVRGRVRAEPIGRYHYLKRRADAVEDCQVTTYLLEVVDELVAFPEMDERRRGWFTPAEAADCADDLGLRDILRDLEARLRAERTGDAASPKAKAGKSKAAKADVGNTKATKSKAAKAKASKPKAVKLKASKSKRATVEPQTLEAVDLAAADGVRVDAGPAEAGAAGAEAHETKPAKRKSAKAKAAVGEAARAKPAKTKAARAVEPDAGAAAPEVVGRRDLN